MRLFILLSLISLPAFAACPNLAGSYVCDEDRNPSKIEQSLTDRVTTYNVDGIILIADGKTRSDDNDDSVVIKSTWKCTSRNVLEGKIATYVEGEHFFTAKQELKKTTAGYSITTSDVNGDYSDTIKCERTAAE